MFHAIKFTRCRPAESVRGGGPKGWPRSPSAGASEDVPGLAPTPGVPRVAWPPRRASRLAQGVAKARRGGRFGSLAAHNKCVCRYSADVKGGGGQNAQWFMSAGRRTSGRSSSSRSATRLRTPPYRTSSESHLKRWPSGTLQHPAFDDRGPIVTDWRPWDRHELGAVE